MSLWIAFIGGLAGSLHCIGMCGGFAVTVARLDPRRNLSRQILYSAGRLQSLVFIGATAGALGASVVSSGWGAVAERALAIVAGTIMCVLALELLGLASLLTPIIGRLVSGPVGATVRSLSATRSPFTPLLLGAANAFLPCHLVYGFAAQAAATGSATDGIAIMAVFGLGTVPAMVAAGLSANAARRLPAVQGWLNRLAGLLLLAFGALTIWRGVAPMHVHVH